MPTFYSVEVGIAFVLDVIMNGETIYLPAMAFAKRTVLVCFTFLDGEHETGKHSLVRG